MDAEHAVKNSASALTLFKDHEGLYVFDDHEAQCTNIIAIHNINLGPALGGCRRKGDYIGRWDPFFDVARLSRGMTYKAALLGVPLGGGKSVMVPWKEAKRLRKGQFLSMGRFVESLGGKYISAEDVGTSVDDIKTMLEVTTHACGTLESHPYKGDPSPITALGVYHSLRAAFYFATGSRELDGRSVYVEGIGKVGMPLAEMLARDGMRLYVSNRSKEVSEREALSRAQDELRATVVTLNDHGEPEHFPFVEVYAPCALGGVVNAKRMATYPPCLRVIAGSANNVLLDPDQDGTALMAKGIVYAPDYLANNRGLWDIYNQMSGHYDLKVVEDGCKLNDHITFELLERSRTLSLPPHRVADQMAEEIFNKKQ